MMLRVTAAGPRQDVEEPWYSVCRGSLETHGGKDRGPWWRVQPRLVDIEQVPRPVVVVRFDLRDQPKRRLWMVLQRPRAELCTAFPGRSEDLIITTDAATLAQWNLRRIAFDQAGQVRVDGPPGLARAFPTWIRPSPFARRAGRTVRRQDVEPRAAESGWCQAAAQPWRPE